MEKRVIDETLVRAWRNMMSDRIDRIQGVLMRKYEPDDEYRILTARLSGILEAVSVLDGLENGRFQKAYRDAKSRPRNGKAGVPPAGNPKKKQKK